MNLNLTLTNRGGGCMYAGFATLVSIFLKVSLLGIGFGCSAEKRVEDLQQSTHETNETAKKMNSNTEDMKDSTEQMSQNTAEMNKTTIEMQKDTSELKKETSKATEATQDVSRKIDGLMSGIDGLDTSTRSVVDEVKSLEVTIADLSLLTEAMKKDILAMYYDLRQGNSLSIRAERLNALDQSASMEAKVSEAAKYFMAFEFQLWKGMSEDTAPKRMALYEEALQEFLWDLRRFMKNSFNRDPDSQENRMKNLYALSAAMHFTNLNQRFLVAGTSHEAVSIFSLLQAGLRAKADVESGLVEYDKVPEYQKAVLTYEKEAAYIIGIRSNFYAAMTLNGLTNLQDPRFFGLPNLFNKLRMLAGPWVPDFESVNSVQIKTHSEWLKESRVARDFLSSEGYGNCTDTKLLTMLRNAKLLQSNDLPATTFSAEKKRSLDDFAVELATWLRQ